MKARKRPQSSARQGYHHGDLKAALLSAAAQLLEKDGAEALSFRAIAREIGVSQTAPYNHFASKEHLLATVAEEGFRRFTALQRAAASTRSPRHRLHALGRAYVAFACAHPQLYRLMFGVGLTDWKRYPSLVEAAEQSCLPIQQALVDVGSHDRPSGKSAQGTWIATWAMVHGLASLLIDGKVDASDIGRLGDRIIGWYAALLVPDVS